MRRVFFFVVVLALACGAAAQQPASKIAAVTGAPSRN